MASAVNLHNVCLDRMSRPEHACAWGAEGYCLVEGEKIELRITALLVKMKSKPSRPAKGWQSRQSDQRRIGGYTDLAALLGVDVAGLAIPMCRFLLFFGALFGCRSAAVDDFIFEHDVEG